MSRPVRLAVDIGGTFVDVIEHDPSTGSIRLHKSSTTPEDPARGVAEAIRSLRSELSPVETFAHGTTLGLNAILERKGAKLGLITNEGFEDLLEVARANVPVGSMYDFQYSPPPPLIPRRRRIGVPGRLGAEGQEIVPLDEAAVLAAAKCLIDEHGVQAIAVCFLHSYRDPRHEQRAVGLIRESFPAVWASASTDITREYREFERTSTVVLDAYIRPLLDDYVERLETTLRQASFDGAFHIMRSGGGAMTANLARSAPLLTVLSGPAGGIAGTADLARRNDWDNVLSFDVGGTSVDACVIEQGEPTEVHEASIDGFPLQIPVFDIRTIGAGGGSIAWVDEGLLKVGPRSAGAVPGPACYGAGGTDCTVTDAALVLGYLDPDDFLGGAMAVDVTAAEDAVRANVADPLGLNVENAAAAVLRVLLARTVTAMREITVERGRDPRDFKLVAFGGAGPLLGPMLGREMGVAATIIPTYPAAFSAIGMLTTDLEYEFSTTVVRPLGIGTIADLADLIWTLSQQAMAVLESQHVPKGKQRIVTRFDLRYRGQEHTIGLDLEPSETELSLAERFGVAHLERHGHRLDEPCEIVTVRVRGVGDTPSLVHAEMAEGRNATVRSPRSRRAYDVFLGQQLDFAVHDRASLGVGIRLSGPVIIQEPTATTVLFSEQSVAVDSLGQLVIASSATETR